MAANKGYHSAQYNTAVCLFNGEGCEKSQNDSFIYFKKAAEQGNKRACHWTALCYEHGVGVGRDIEAAIKWESRAIGEEV